MNNIDVCLTVCPCSDCSMPEDECVLAKAYQKQEIQQPEITPENEHICPVCRCSNGSRFNYCWNCGQRLQN